MSTSTALTTSEAEKRLTSSEQKALTLLGQGHDASVVARTIGLSESRISQLLSDETFSALVSERRFVELSKHNVRDSRYDNLEDKLLDKLESSLPLVYKFSDALKGLQVLNAAKRRGVSSPQQAVMQQTVVPLVVPQTLVQNFVVNSANQVISAGAQSLVTIQSSALDTLITERKLGNQNGHPAPAISDPPLISEVRKPDSGAIGSGAGNSRPTNSAESRAS